MNPISVAVNRPLNAMAAGVAALGSGVMRWVTGAYSGMMYLLGRTTINYASEIGDPTKNPIVVAVTHWIARNFPEAPVRITRTNADGTAEKIQPGGAGPGYALRLLERPNPHFDGIIQWQATIIDFYCRGDAYWAKVRNDSDRVVELWWIPWHMIRPYWEPDSRRFIDYYIYTVDGVEYRIRVEDIIHFRYGIDPYNVRRGLSPLASLFREIYTDDEAANFTAVLLKNFAVPGVILAPANTGGPLNKADPEAVKTKFMETFGGDQRGSVMALSAPTDVKVLSWSPEQMNLRELRRIPEERITAVLGVSAIVAGLGAGLDRSTFTNFGEARRAAYQESIIPLQRLLAAALEVQYLPEFADLDRDPLDIDFDTSKASALQEALDAVWKRLMDGASKGLVTRAEFKRGVGLPVGAGDDVYLLANNIVPTPVGDGGNPPVPTPPTRRIPANAPDVTLTKPEVPLLASGNGHVLQEVRCSGEFRDAPCKKLLAEAAGPGFRAKCERCGTVNTLELESVA